MALGLLVSVSSCGDFLDEYSQDMVVPKTVSDLEEVLIGETYMKSTETSYGMSSSTCGFFNMLDDDINTVGINSSERLGSYSAYTYVVNGMFGYFAWQQDVRYNLQHDSYSSDDGTWNDLYHRINLANIILDEIEGVPHTSEKDQSDYTRVKGEFTSFVPSSTLSWLISTASLTPQPLARLTFVCR